MSYYKQGDIEVSVRVGSEDRVKKIATDLSNKLNEVDLSVVETALLSNLLFGCGLSFDDEQDDEQ